MAKKKAGKKKAARKKAASRAPTRPAKSATKKHASKKAGKKKAAGQTAGKTVNQTAKKKPATGASGKVSAPPPPPMMPTDDQIAVRAYQIWERNGHQPGQDQANWRQAEAELMAEAGF